MAKGKETKKFCVHNTRKFLVLALLAILPLVALCDRLGEEISYTVMRVSAIYLIIFAALRLLGKREFSQLSLVELISLLLIPDIVSQGVVGEDSSFVNALVAVSTLFFWVALTSLVIACNKSVGKVLMGKPSILVRKGKLIKPAMEEENITKDEILTSARQHGLKYLSQVEMAVLETDGKISIIPMANSTESKLR